MSWLGGNENTTFLTDLTSLWHNATTGELTDAQKTEIATASTQEYLPCSQNTSSPECQALLKEQQHLVDLVAPNTDCVLRLSSTYCLKSWSQVAIASVAAIFGLFLLYGIVTSYIARGK